MCEAARLSGWRRRKRALRSRRLSGRGFVFETSNVLFENEKRAHALRLRPRSALTMTANAPTRIPARFVRIRGLTSSTHLNGELARLGKWLPQRARWEVSVCDSRNLGPTKEVVLAIKETNVEDVDDDETSQFSAKSVAPWYLVVACMYIRSSFFCFLRSSRI